MIKSVDKQFFYGFNEDYFERELRKIQGAINSCKHQKPNKQIKENRILSLIKNLYFWGVLSVLIGGTYTLSYDFGYTKFEKEKIELHNQNKIYEDSILILEGKIDVIEKQVSQIITDNKTEAK